jgi:DNA processing protein
VRKPGRSPFIPSATPAPWNHQARLWWLLWCHCPGLGPQRLAELVASFETLEAAWYAPTSSLGHLCQWSDRLLQGIEDYRKSWEANPLPQAAKRWHGGRGILLPGDPRWPAKMDQAHPPPAALYWSGRGWLWRHLSERRAVAVVGTRRPSRHGLSVSRHIGAVLAQAGWPVVSGLAAGIDGAVHQGCLQGGGVPIGVLGTPLERVYPRHHAALQASVGQQGLLVSELSPDAPVSKGSFALRNRLQVALASALILVECPVGSGALHSAELAWGESLPLWVVPADTDRLSAEGSNGFLARGATPLTRPEDLLRLLGPGPLKPPAAGPDHPLHPPLTSSPTPLTQQLLKVLGRGASLEELCQALHTSAQDLLPQLLELEACGTLIAEPGLFWRPRSLSPIPLPRVG